jgi:hypothetical protein
MVFWLQVGKELLEHRPALCSPPPQIFLWSLGAEIYVHLAS